MALSLEEHCKSLTKKELFDLAIKLCEKALPIWEEYSSGNQLTYRDTVVGMHHEVQADLLSNSISYCQKNSIERFLKKRTLSKLLGQFTDPIIALQDFDWELPESVKNTFYSVYNLLEGIYKPATIFEELTHYVSVNQAADALEESGRFTVDQISKMIYS